MRRALAAAPLLLLAACASTIDEGQQIKEIAAPKDEPAPQVLPLEKSQRVGPSTELALENYEKLLDLPQDPVTRMETMRRLADLQLELDEAGGSTSLEQSDQRLRRSVALYTAVLTEQPNAPSNDRVLYQLARAYQNLGEHARAEEVLQRLTRDYPQSGYAHDARFRRAELLFKLGQFDDAAGEYEKVLTLGENTPYFEPAQYKYGWSQYRQSKYDKALDVFLAILNRELPPGELTDRAAALDGVRQGKKDMAADALRVVNLSLALMGGPEAAKKYFGARGEPPYVALLYQGLAEHLLEKKRYTDSANTYTTFVEKHPDHALAPAFMSRAIAAQDAGGFVDLVVQEKERYAKHFDPSAEYWKGRSVPPEVMKELRGHLEDLARHYQARGQKVREEDAVKARTDFQAAARWYRRLLELYPSDPKAAELRFLMAESLYDSGEVLAAAQEYDRVVAEHPAYEKSADAAYAALLAYQRLGTAAPEPQRPAALRQSVQAALKLAERFPRHPQALPALTRAAEDLAVLKAWDEAIAVGARVLKAGTVVPEALRRTALTVSADAQFSQKRYAEAEAAYVELRAVLPPAAPEREPVNERLASAVYQQGEALREAGNPKGAAEAFLRVGRRVPAAGIRATADYDAAAMLIAANSWTQAIAVLEAFRAANPASSLLPEVDKKLAVAYENAGRPKDSAEVLKRIAARATESANDRRDAAWLAIQMLEQTRDPQAAAAYEAYLQQYPRPFDRAVQARRKLADFALARGDANRRQHWLREIISADTYAGATRTPLSRQLAAEATLELGRQEAAAAARIQLKLPLKQTVPPKKDATERAIATLSTAVDYGIAEVTTAATYELGRLYEEFSKALLKSERPKRMSALELEQYNLLLEEQAFPFEEKAIEFHEANLKHVAQGVYNDWVGRSLQALAAIAPGRYGKREQTADAYDALQ